jgi:hypothetical protein
MPVGEPLPPPTAAVATATGKPAHTAWHLLFDDPSKATEELTKAIKDKGVLDAMPDGAPRLGAAANRFLLGSVVAAIQQVLNQIGLKNILVSAWTGLEEVEQALQATKKDGGTRNVQVLTHELTSKHSPRIDMLVNEVPTPLLNLIFSVGFLIKGCDLEISKGEIGKVTPGHIGALASLKTGSITVVKHTVDKLDTSSLFGQTPPPTAAATAAGLKA